MPCSLLEYSGFLTIYNQDSNPNISILQRYDETEIAVIIVEGVCIGLGSLMILVTLLHLLIFEKLKTTYLMVQAQVCYKFVPLKHQSTYRNRATNRRSRLVAAPLSFQAKTHFLCVFYVVIWTSK